MESQALKVFVSILIGAFIGGTIALEVSNALWWIGALAGGAIGYISYEWKQVITAIPKAWKRAIEARKKIESFHVSRNVLIYIGWSTIVGINFGTWLNVLYFGIFYMFDSHQALTYDFFLSRDARIFLACGIVSAVAGALISCDKVTSNYMRTNDMRHIAIHGSVPVVLFWYLPRGIWKLLYVLSGFIVVFSTMLFRLINSDARLICGSYAMIGAVIGYAFGYAAIGALIAAFLGAVHDLLIRHFRPEWRKTS